MSKNIIRWLTNIVFFIIYFVVYAYIIGRRLPIGLGGNLLSLFILIFINIPLSVFTSVKVLSVIGNKSKKN